MSKILQNTFYAIIPARSGSKGIPNKNIREVSGHPLIAWSIFAAQQSQYISRTIVSTDSDEYATIAKSYGADAPFLRPAEFSTDSSQDIDFFMHALEWLQDNEGAIPEYMVHLRPTSPLREAIVIDKAIEKILADKTATSLCSAHELAHPPCKYFVLNADDTFSGLLGEQYVSLPRQECPKGYQGNGYVDIIKSEHLLQTGNLYGHRRLAFLTPECGDIDSLSELLDMGKKSDSFNNLVIYQKRNSISA